MLYYVYVLRSLKDGKLYTGITNNLGRRLAEHNRGKASTPSTLNRGSFKLICCEKQATRKNVREREKFFKSGIGRTFLKQNNSPVAQR